MRLATLHTFRWQEDSVAKLEIADMAAETAKDAAKADSTIVAIAQDAEETKTQNSSKFKIPNSKLILLEIWNFCMKILKGYFQEWFSGAC